MLKQFPSILTFPQVGSSYKLPTVPSVSPLSCLSEKLIFLLPPALFQLPLSTLLCFPHPPLPLSQHDQSMDLLFFLQPHQLFGQKIKHVRQCPSFYHGQVSFQCWQLSKEKCKELCNKPQEHCMKSQDYHRHVRQLCSTHSDQPWDTPRSLALMFYMPWLVSEYLQLQALNLKLYKLLTADKFKLTVIILSFQKCKSDLKIPGNGKSTSLWQSWDKIPGVQHCCAIHSLLQAHPVLWAGYVWLHYRKIQDLWGIHYL